MKSLSYIFLMSLVIFAFNNPLLLAGELTTVETTLNDVEKNSGLETEYSVYSEADGRIYWVDANQVDLVNNLKISLNLGESVELIIENDEKIIEVKNLGKFTEKIPTVNNQKDFAFAQTDIINDNSSFVPTALSMSEATVLFNALNTRDTPTSQCYKRAHTWAYDMFILRPMNESLTPANPIDHGKYQELVKQRNGVGINSMKVFLFYTRKFNRDCNNRQLCKWWFHVAPYVMADGEEVVLDREFTLQPLKLKDWYSFPDFMGAYERGTGTSNTVCPVIKSFKDYKENLYTGICYLRKVPMYYYDPRAVELADAERVPVRTEFSRSEVNWSRAHFLD